MDKMTDRHKDRQTDNQRNGEQDRGREGERKKEDGEKKRQRLNKMQNFQPGHPVGKKLLVLLKPAKCPKRQKKGTYQCGKDL